jgi:hypothetical protein
MDAINQREKIAQLTSSVGAGILGVGIGAMASRPLEGLEPIVIAVGLVLHLWGMIDNHRVERGTSQPTWATAAYWTCWIGLIALVGIVILRAL